MSQDWCVGQNPMDGGQVLEGEDILDDDDYSPRCLVIAHEDSSSAPPSRIATPPRGATPPVFAVGSSQQPTPLMELDLPSTLPNTDLTTPSVSDMQDFLSTLPPLLPVSVSSEEKREKLKFMAKLDVPADGTLPMDTLCIYRFACGPEYIEIITRRNLVPLIPVKNVYLKAIPGLKQNVLSARISKLGIRSLVLSEPYISVVKKINIGLTGSSHYITVSDFIKICNYFKKPIDSFIPKLDLIVSTQPPEEVLQMFNNPDAAASQNLLTQLTNDAAGRKEGASEIPGIGGGAMIRVSGIQSSKEGGRKDTPGINFAEVDPRKITHDGKSIYILMKEGSPYLPNPELAKILPAINRTAMENFRNTYGISVTQASKTDMDVMKCLGIVSVKAGRTLLYKVADVVAMFHHWKCGVPDFVEKMARGELLGEKVTIPFPPLGDMPTGTPSPHAHTSSPSLMTSSSLLSAQVATPASSHPSTSTGNGSTPTFEGVTAQKKAWHGVTAPDMSPVSQHSSLTPDKFQVPVQLLNSLAAEGAATQLAGIMNNLAAIKQEEARAQAGEEEEEEENGEGSKKKRRRNSSITGSPLDDQQLEYNTVDWGQQSLTLLCSNGVDSPFVSIPELMQKVLHQQKHLITVQQRTRLGVTLHPASSIQTHMLRARGSIDGSAGNVKLVSLADAIKLAVAGKVEIPGAVLQRLAALSKGPMDKILLPPEDGSVPASSQSGSQPRVTMEVVSSSSSNASVGGGVGGAVSTGRALHPAKMDGAGTSMGRATGRDDLDSHPDIVKAPHDWRLDGTMCQVKWDENTVVVYTDSDGNHFMGLYQVYDVLFRSYATRMNFKMRMRKLNIRSNRAPSSIRMKLVQLQALPTNCPVCGLVTVNEVETLAKSYGMTPPPVFYEKFITSTEEEEEQMPRPLQAQASGSPHLQATDSKSLPLQAQPLQVKESPSSADLPPSLFSYQFDPSDDSGPSNQEVPRLPHGLVPFLTSSGNTRNEQSNSPNLITTSLGTTLLGRSTIDTSSPLIVRIPRKFTRFRVGPRPILPAPPAVDSSSRRLGGVTVSYIAPGNTLQNLAKKITQKSKKTIQQGQAANTTDSKEMLRVCPSCGHQNGQHKKRCEACNEFIVGTRCQACSTLNYFRSKACMKCGIAMPVESSPGTSKVQPHNLPGTLQIPPSQPSTSLGSLGQAGSSRDQAEVPGSNTSDSSSHPTSPCSPKFSAPPIRSAVLKSMFPQNSATADASVKSASAKGVGSQQVAPKTTLTGGNRKCLECGHLNSKMAKKCSKCRSHLQGRACTSCGRPNLNHVTECYKCGAVLPPPSTKTVYANSHGSKVYKSTMATEAVVEARVISGRAPLSCIRCSKFRAAGFFKCGRCGDAFKLRPLVDPLGGNPSSALPPAKKRKISSDVKAPKEPAKIEPTLLQSFAHNLMSLDLQDSLVPLLVTKANENKEKLSAIEREFGAADAEYQVALAQAKDAEERFKLAKAELDGLFTQIEHTDRILQEVSRREKAAREETEILPKEIEDIKDKMAAAKNLFSAIQ